MRVLCHTFSILRIEFQFNFIFCPMKLCVCRRVIRGKYEYTVKSRFLWAETLQRRQGKDVWSRSHIGIKPPPATRGLSVIFYHEASSREEAVMEGIQIGLGGFRYFVSLSLTLRDSFSEFLSVAFTDLDETWLNPMKWL